MWKKGKMFFFFGKLCTTLSYGVDTLLLGVDNRFDSDNDDGSLLLRKIRKCASFGTWGLGRNQVIIHDMFKNTNTVLLILRLDVGKNNH